MNKLGKYVRFSTSFGRVSAKITRSSSSKLGIKGVRSSGRFLCSGFITSCCWRGNERMFLCNKAPPSKLYDPLFTRGFKRASKLENEVNPTAPPPPPRLGRIDFFHHFVKPASFATFMGLSSVTACTIWQYENYRSELIQKHESVSGLQKLPPHAFRRLEDIKLHIKELQKSYSGGKEIFWSIFVLNALVFLAWRNPAWTPAMYTWFTTTPASRVIALPMLLSAFSHQQIFHMAANMFVLHSFAPGGSVVLGKEQFLAMYLTAGVVASLGSILNKVRIGSAIPSLGASGAIMGVTGLVCSNMPDTKIGIIFIPGLQFSAETALYCMMAVDAIGLIAGWRLFDHAAHLSGCLFGVVYNSPFGAPLLSSFRNGVTKSWDSFRTGTSGGRGGT